jgi:hypothetical protein
MYGVMYVLNHILGVWEQTGTLVSHHRRIKFRLSQCQRSASSLAHCEWIQTRMRRYFYLIFLITTCLKLASINILMYAAKFRGFYMMGRYHSVSQQYDPTQRSRSSTYDVSLAQSTDSSSLRLWPQGLDTGPTPMH